MHDQPSSGSARLLEPDQIARTVLGMMFELSPAPSTVEELVRQFAGFSGNRTDAQLSVEDGLADLMANGLVYREGALLFVSQAAVRGRTIAE